VVDQSESENLFVCPESLRDLIEVSGVYVVRGRADGGLPRYCIDLAFPDLGFFRTLRSQNVTLLGGKVEAVLGFWAGNWVTHDDYEADQQKPSAIGRLNTDSLATLNELENLLGELSAIVIDWDLLLRKFRFKPSPMELFGIPAEPPYITYDPAGRPEDIERLNQVNQPNLDDTVSQFSPLAKMFNTGEVREAVDDELRKYSDDRSAVAVTNAERRATLKQAQAIYDASLARFESEREQDVEALERVKAAYELREAGAVEDHCDAVLLNAYCPDVISRNWTVEYLPGSCCLMVELDLPTAGQMELPRSWEWSAETGAAIANCLTPTEANVLCDKVAYQLVIRTIRDLFATDEVDAIERIVCNGRMITTNPATGAQATYTVMSVGVDKSDAYSLDVHSSDAQSLFESLGGLAAGLPHQFMPVEPLKG